MDKLRSEKLLIAYWIPDVGIGPHDHMKHVQVPLTNVLNYQRLDGTPQINIIILFKATFNGTPHDFEPPYIKLEDGIKKELTPQGSQTVSNVKLLQEQGIKVLLSITGDNSPGGIGWSSIPENKNTAFTQWLADEILHKYGLDGIDIDDEWSEAVGKPQNFVNTIGVLRYNLNLKKDYIISKALWDDINDFTTSVSANLNQGKYLHELIDIGATMAYGWDINSQKENISNYLSISVNDYNVGLSPEQLCIGVQAGPSSPKSSWMTPLSEVKELAEWAVNHDPTNGRKDALLGMMLFTFSQDIQQFTYRKQNDPDHMWPNTNDHEWQRAIISVWE